MPSPDVVHNVALIGFGLAGKAFHAPLIATTCGLQLAAIVSSQHEEVHASYPDVANGMTYAEVLADPSVTLVVLATPDHLHAEHSLAAIAAGKHVVIDKPFAPTLDEARRIADRAKHHGTLLSIFHNRRWDADFLTLQHLIESGQLGDIVEFDSHFDRLRVGVGTRWKDHRGAGVWQDLGPHLVDQALVLFGLPQAVSADLAVLKPGGLAPDYAQVTLRYPERRVTLHMSQTRHDPTLRLSVHGTRASYVKHGLDPQEDQSKSGMVPGDPRWGFDPSDGRLVTRDAQGHATTTTVPTLRGDYAAFYRQIAQALSGTGPLPVTADQALSVMRVIEAGIQSHQQRREIVLTI